MKTPPFKLERYFARYEFASRYLLSSSDCESISVRELLAFEPGAEEELHDLWLGYTEYAGAPRLRESISRLYDTIDPDQLLVHAGAEEVIFGFMNVALTSGDHLIVHHPCYQSSYSVAEANGVEVTRWNAREQDGWRLDPDDLAAAITPRTKAVLLNCPNNPTGYLMDRERFDATIERVRSHGLYLFSDEVYRELEYDAADRLPAACDVYEKAVSLGVTSKTYGLPGLRIGWVATHDRGLYQRMGAFKDYVTISNSAPSEVLARVAMDHRERLAERSRDIVRTNLELADAFFARHSDTFEWRRPMAGAIAFPRFLAGSAESFCTRMAEEAGVMLVPGTLFDVDDAHIRFGFGRLNFVKAIGVLEATMATASGSRPR